MERRELLDLIKGVVMRRIIFAAVLLASLPASAQSSAMYEQLRYRSDDPFVFCTQGQKTPAKCWIPLPPYTGNWTYNLAAYCNPPYSPYGKPWTQADYDSLNQYLRVCPNGITPGTWNGKGSPENSPGSH